MHGGKLATPAAVLEIAETAAAQITGGGLARIEKRAKLNET
jgi:hypothetical protein